MKRKSLSLLAGVMLVSCNLTESVKTSAPRTVRIVPRLQVAEGASLPVTDSVHVKLSSTSPAKTWYDSTLPWSSKFVVIAGVPSGTGFTLVMEGKAKQADGTSALWWSGSQSGTAGTAQTVDAQVLTVPVTIRDTIAPKIVALSKDTVLDSAVAGVRLRWTVKDANLLRVTAGKARTLSPVKDTVTDSVSLSLGQILFDTLQAVDSTGNLSRSIVKVTRKSTRGAMATVAIPWNPAISYDSFVDARDGQTYRSVVIGTQKWMAQNLNYRKSNTGTDTVGVCYNNSADSCAKYGRLYTWNEAMAGSASSNTSPSGIKGVCPTGWHVPSDDEWTTLQNYVDSKSTIGEDGILKSLSGWSVNGKDLFGFTSIPSGTLTTGSFLGAGILNDWWSATLDQSNNQPWIRGSGNDGGNLYQGSSYLGGSTNKYSARCVSDSVVSVSATWASLAVAHGQRQLPAGTFQMGSTTGQLDEAPVHSVTLSSFWMDTTDVTQQEFQTLMGRNNSYFGGKPNNPVERVSWYDAIAFSNARSKRDGYDTIYTYTGTTVDGNGSITAMAGLSIDMTKNGYHLPTEAQWEYAARAGSTTKFYWGDDASVAGDYAWYIDNASYMTHPVATKKPNSWGLYDMSGNVWNWTQDWYAAYTAVAATDPLGPTSGTTKARRGGSWDASIDQSSTQATPTFIAADLRTSFRKTDVGYDFPYANSGYNFGFRCARGGGGSFSQVTVVNPAIGTPSGNSSFTGHAEGNIGSTCAALPANAPFTIEYWVKTLRSTYAASVYTYQDVGEQRGLYVDKLDTGDSRWQRTWASGFWALHPDINLLRVSDNDTILAGIWSHVAFVYTGNEGIIFMNGVEKVRKSDTRSMLCGSSAKLVLHADGVEIDNVRISTVARYSSTFTPPTNYTRDTSTAMLWTFDGANANSTTEEIQGYTLASDTTDPVSFIAR